MSWQTEMTPFLRVLVGDNGVTQTYTDSRLQQVLAVAGLQVGLEMVFSQTFVASVSGSTIIPDPTASGTTDESYVNLTCLKAACLLDRGEAVIAARQAISVVDGKSSVNLTGIARAKFELLKNGGWCAAYEEAKLQYQQGQVRIAGAAVLTPFRIYAQGGFFTRVPGRDRDYLY